MRNKHSLRLSKISGSYGGENEDHCLRVLRRVISKKYTDVSELLTASNMKVMYHRLDVSEDGKKLHNGEIHNLHSLPHVIKR